MSRPAGAALTGPPTVPIRIGRHEFTVYLGIMEQGRRQVDLVEVTPPLPRMGQHTWTKFLLVLDTALAFEGITVTRITKDLFLGIKDGLVE